MALYRVTLRQEYAGQEVLNRWHYVSDDTSIAALPSVELMAKLFPAPTGTPKLFGSTSLAYKIQHIQVEDVTFESVEVRNIYDPTDFFEVAFALGVNGEDVTHSGLAPYTAFGFLSSRVTLDIRRGTKRFAGVPADADSGMGVIDASYVTALDSLATVMSDPQSVTVGAATITFTPAIVSLKRTTDSEGKKHTAYYPDIETQMEHTATGISWEPYSTLRTQDSRQYGRGR